MRPLMVFWYAVSYAHPLPKLITFLNEEADIRVRCAVDLPTGITEEGSDNPLRADFTYSTGIVKTGR